MAHQHEHDGPEFRGFRGRFWAWFMRSPLRGLIERMFHGSPRSRLYEIMALRGDEVLIDVGAGSGYYAIDIAKKLTEGRVIAVDESTEMLDSLRGQIRKNRLDSRVEVIQGTAEELEIEDATADIGFSVAVWHHLGDPEQATRQLMRAVKPGGKVVIVEWLSAPTEADEDTHGAFDEQGLVDLLNGAGVEGVALERIRNWVIGYGTVPEAV